MEFLRTSSQDLEQVMYYELRASEKAYVIAWTKAQHLQAIKCNHHIIIKQDSRNIGYLIMSRQEDNLELKRFVIFEPNKGYGKEALMLLKKYAFEEIDCHRFWLDVRMHNKIAINLYKKLGFVEEGILRDAVKHKGTYLSVMVMSILRGEYDQETR